MEHLLTWGLGICFTGFLALLGIVSNFNLRVNQKIEELKVDMEKRVTYGWIEDKIDKEFTALNKTIGTMNDALVGTVEKRGIITMFHHHEDRIRNLEIAKESCLHCKKNPLKDE